MGDLRHVVATHRVYKCAVAGSSTISPELDPTKWSDIRPTNKWAPFDIYTSTAATATTSISYTLTPGYFNAVALYGLTGAQYALTLKDAPGGTVIWSRTGYLMDDPVGWYEYLFSPPKQLTKLVFTGLPIRPGAELTITITAASGQPVGIGMIVCGDFVSLAGSGEWGGTQYGASAEPVTYSYIKTADDGTTTIVRRHAGTNLVVSIVMPRNEADAVLQSVQNVLDMTTFGIGSGKMSYDSFGIATLSINVKGLI